MSFSKITFSTLASTLTIYLTASTSVYSSKDSPSVPHPGFNPDFPPLPPRAAPTNASTYGATDSSDSNGQKGEEEKSAIRPIKTLYFAAGSGIPEIKTILSGELEDDAAGRASVSSARVIADPPPNSQASSFEATSECGR